jgi:hypothetical protein
METKYFGNIIVPVNWMLLELIGRMVEYLGAWFIFFSVSSNLP